MRGQLDNTRGSALAKLRGLIPSIQWCINDSLGENPQKVVEWN